MLQNVGRTIMDNGGVLTDVRSYGVQWLAYTVRKPFEKYDQVSRLVAECLLGSLSGAGAQLAELWVAPPIGPCPGFSPAPCALPYRDVAGTHMADELHGRAADRAHSGRGARA